MRKIFLFIFLLCVSHTALLKADESNKFIVCDNSLEMVEWNTHFIKEACHSIEIGACYAGGKIIQGILTEIEKRMEVCPDLKVHMLTTPILLEEQDTKFLEHLQNKYPNRFHLVHASNVIIIWPNLSGVDNHVKMMVIDEKYFTCGGSNLDHFCCEGTTTPEGKKNHPMGNAFPAGSRDQDVAGRGSLAKQLRKIFYQHYALWEHYNETKTLEKDPETFAHNNRYFSVEGKNPPFVNAFELSNRLIDVKPTQVSIHIGGSHQKNNAITTEYIKLIKEAKKEILIANLYFSPLDALFNALMDAVNRGVKVSVITNGINERSPNYTQYFCWANRITYVPMFYGKTFHFWDAFSCKNLPTKKTKIYEYYVNDVILHKKVMIVDDNKFVIGSYNLSTKSDVADYEIVLVFDSAEIVTQAKKVFERDRAHSIEVTPEQARGWYFDPFISYLGEVQKKFHGIQ